MSEILSLNVSLPREVRDGDRTLRTGIFKQPVTGRRMLQRTNLEGDGQADLENHGGRPKAVCVYSHDHYAYWERELGLGPLPFGQFGENLTVRGLTEDAVHIGDIFRVGDAKVEVSQPRVPCFKLGIRMGSPAFRSSSSRACAPASTCACSRRGSWARAMRWSGSRWGRSGSRCARRAGCCTSTAETARASGGC